MQDVVQQFNLCVVASGRHCSKMMSINAWRRIAWLKDVAFEKVQGSCLHAVANVY